MADFDANIIPATFNVNSLIWVSSLEIGEQGITKRIQEDLLPYLDEENLRYKTFEPRTATELLDYLQNIAREGRVGLRPILHLDVHGDDEHGIKIAPSGEFIPWSKLVAALREINVAIDNNLCVISCACYSIKAAYEVTISEPCPFYMFIAPREEVSSSFLEDNVFRFYKSAFQTSDFYGAYERHLAQGFLFHYCERMLLYQFVKYVRDYCIGKKGQPRREELLTKVIEAGQAPNRQQRRKKRHEIKLWGRPNQAMLERFAKNHVSIFLMGKPLSFSIRHVASLIEIESRKEDRSHLMHERLRKSA
jgi:hypothetical protein